MNKVLNLWFLNQVDNSKTFHKVLTFISASLPGTAFAEAYIKIRVGCQGSEK